MIFLFVINSNASNIKSVFIGYEQFVIEPDTIIVYDTIYTYDTVFTYQTIHDTVFYYDSLFVDEIEKMKKIEHKKADLRANCYDNFDFDFRNSIIQKNKIEKSNIDIIWAYGIKSYRASFPETNDLYKFREKAIQSANSLNIGFKYNYNIWKKLSLSSGLSYSLSHDNFSFSYDNLNIDTSLVADIFENIHSNVDSVYFINIDSLFSMGDTIWETFYDTSYSYTFDTNYVEKYDTVFINHSKNAINKIEYLQIPLIASWYFNFGNLNFSLSSGIINEFLIRHKKYEVYFEDDLYSTKLQTKNELQSYSLSLYISCLAEYKFSTQWSFLVEPYFKQSIFNLYKNDDYKLKTNISGLKTGLRYYF
ncbi:MAG: hypothetical protein HN704_04550 [Bacteroidetes bacterium]|nr:hypothetical protein [Bacteroidota bacterium]MBT6685981.1 hypothetical protein [Bacteroidota bacterium]MBT7144419.1 hypothetical protein [Bacteroidota bacterium]MBT7490862.1 hypothetical protein [Bacteroidota bacterium]